VVVLGLAVAHSLAHDYSLIGSSRLGWSLVYVALLIVAGYAVGLPDLVGSRRTATLAGLAAAAVAAIGLSVVQLLAGAPLLPRFVVLGAPAILLPLAVLASALDDEDEIVEAGKDRVVVVAGLDEGFALEDELNAAPERTAAIACVLAPEAATANDTNRQPLVEVAARADATAVVLDRTAAGDDSIVAQAARLHECGVKIRTVSLFYEEWLGKIPLTELERISLMFDIGELHRARYGRMKRILDLAAGGVGLALLGLVTPFVLLGNAVANRGPLFFRQERVGKGGRTFVMVKFRTMRGGADGFGAGHWTVPGDRRITPFGSWMRRTHLDELPQVLNVLRGDLSVVGPRPEQPTYADQLDGKIPFYRLRHLVRPGLTGWAQVKYGYGGTDGEALEKLQYEFYYLRHQSLALDLRIIGRTLRSVVGGTGR